MLKIDTRPKSSNVKGIIMHYQKYIHTQVAALLRHDERSNKNYSNPDINLERSSENYQLATPQKTLQHIGGKLKSIALTPYEAYKKRKNEVHSIRRKDVVTCIGIVTSAPKGLMKQQERAFFEETYNFLTERYGEQNIFSSIVHVSDEKGQPHMHTLLLPIISNEKGTGGKTEKLGAKYLIDRTELKTVHKAHQVYIHSKGIIVNILTGETQGRKRETTERFKLRMNQEREREQKGVFINEHTR
jgi:hypothetical protein